MSHFTLNASRRIQVSPPNKISYLHVFASHLQPYELSTISNPILEMNLRLRVYVTCLRLLNSEVLESGFESKSF